MSKYIIEFIGTFFLALTITFTGNPLAIGAMLIAMIYMGGYISGAHYNPAVTLAVLVRGKAGFPQSLLYWVVQILGAAAAIYMFNTFAGEKFIPQPAEIATFGQALIMEALITFALATVVLHTATSEETANNHYYGLAIGLVIMAGAFAGGLSGGVYNPAIALGSLVADAGSAGKHLPDLWIYLIGPLSGGLAASLVYRLTHHLELRHHDENKDHKLEK